MHEKHTVTIESLNQAGQGICRLDGMAVFVDGALPGDQAEIEILQRKQSYATARLVHLFEASPDRVKPYCPLADRCGGCQLQHLSYDGQLRWKRQQVIDGLVHITGLPADEASVLTRSTVASPQEWEYRNKVQFPVSGTAQDSEIGFFEPRSHTIVDGDVCPVQHPVSNRLRAIVRAWIAEQNVPPYNEEKRKGLLRHIMARVGFSTHEVMLVLVLFADRKPVIFNDVSALISRCQEACRGMGLEFRSFQLNYQPKPTNLILGRRFELIWGEDAITEEILGLHFRVSAGAFFQINPGQTEQLYRLALEAASLTGSETVFDLYCGTGSISLLLALHARQVTGIELFPAAIDDARLNAIENGIRNAEFHVGAAEKVVPALYGQGRKADVVVVDPPRKGCDQRLLDTMLDMEPNRIVYVSCNPATLARDLKVLLAGGSYKLESVQPVDMFPWTSHVESVVLMSRVDK